MKSSIFVVRASGGEYDDAWETPLYAVTELEAANAAVDAERDRHERVCAVYDEVCRVFHEALASTPSDAKEVPPCPKGPAKPTKQNREEYRQALARWDAERRPIVEHNAKEYDRIRRLASATAAHTALDAGLNESDLPALGFDANGLFVAYHLDRRSSFSHYELELL